MRKLPQFIEAATPRPTNHPRETHDRYRLYPSQPPLRPALPGCSERPALGLDPTLMRSADIMHLVGDAAKLRAATGWRPTIDIDRILKEVADAEAD